MCAKEKHVLKKIHIKHRILLTPQLLERKCICVFYVDIIKIITNTQSNMAKKAQSLKIILCGEIKKTTVGCNKNMHESRKDGRCPWAHTVPSSLFEQLKGWRIVMLLHNLSQAIHVCPLKGWAFTWNPDLGRYI